MTTTAPDTIPPADPPLKRVAKIVIAAFQSLTKSCKWAQLSHQKSIQRSPECDGTRSPRAILPHTSSSRGDAGFFGSLTAEGVRVGKRGDGRRTLNERITSMGGSLPNGAIYHAVDNPDGRISLRYVSAGIESLIGRTPKELIATPALLFDQIVEEDRQAFIAAKDQAVQAGGILEFQLRILTVEGDLKWVLCCAVPERRALDNAVTWDGVLIDVTARRVAELALQASEAKFRSLADTFPQLVWSYLPDGKPEYFNKGWLEYTGTSLRESLRKGWTAFVHPQDHKAAQDRWKECLKYGAAYEHECRLRCTSDGTYRWFITRAAPTYDSRRAIHRWVGSCTDVHDQKVFLEEREALLESERVARSEAEKANLSKDQFVAVLSHELRAPLHATLGWAQLIKKGQLDSKGLQQAIDIIEKNTRLQAQLISDLLDINRISSGKIKLELHPMDIQEVIKGTVESQMLAAREKGVTLKHVPGAVCQVSGDAVRLQQAIGNIINNAIKFTPSCGEVHISSSVSAGIVTIVISDTGDGIDSEFMPRIFDRYAQADPSSSRKHGGLGLGLSIVRHLVELHGGQVGVSSLGKGRGSTFTVSLPCFESNEANAVAVPCQQPHDECLGGVKVLIVDDEQDSRDLLERILEDHRATVRTAGNVEAALECMNLFEADVIVSDISMPGKDGYSLMKELVARRNRGERIPPVIAVTAFTRQEDKDRVFQAGFQRHLSKPIEASELLSTVLNLSLPDLNSENRTAPL